MLIQNRDSLFVLQRLLVIFWALWWAIAFVSDVLGVLQHIHQIPGTMFDGNYPMIKKAFENYVSYDIVPVVAFGILLVWEFLSAAFLIWASFLSFNQEKWFRATRIAFIVSMGLWMFYFLGDQTLLLFNIESGDMPQAGLQFISLVLILIIENKIASSKD